MVVTLNSAIRKIWRQPAVLTALEEMGAVPADNSPAEFTQQIKHDIQTYGNLVRTLGIKLG